MARKKVQRDKALCSDKKIWLVIVCLKEKRKTTIKLMKEGKWIMVYVVDNSMAMAITKAVYYFGRKTGIKSMNLKKSYDKNRIKITIRRANKIEIINSRAGMGLKVAERYKAMNNGMEVI